MSAWRFIIRSLVHHWRINLAVGFGVLVATAVLTGALLVGDSVRGSLRRLTVERLGRIDEVLVTDRFFRIELASELAGTEAFARIFSQALPAIVFSSATVERPDVKRPSRARGVMVIGCDERFWDQRADDTRPVRLPGVDEIVLNQPLADELGVQVGDRVVLRLPASNQVPADSPLGRKTDRVRSLAELTVVDVVAAEGLGRFHLQASQQLSRNAYLSLETLQDALDQRGKVNAILVAGNDAGQAPTGQSAETLAGLLRPTLGDLGFRIKDVRQRFRPPNAESEETALEYFHLTSDRMLLEESVDQAAVEALGRDKIQPVLTYLANTIEKVTGDANGLPSQVTAGDAEPAGGRRLQIPYSTITAIDSRATLGPLVDVDGELLEPLADDEIVLNDWAAGELDAKLGDQIRVTYFAPETTHGVAEEGSATFTLKAIVSLIEPVEPYRRRAPARYDRRPTPANDPDLTPAVPGITDQQSIDDWDPPFPFEYDRIQDEDEDYWDKYRTTPKAFVNLAAGRRLWGSRFGQTTSYRIPKSPELNAQDIEAKLLAALRPHHADLGFDFLHVKRGGLEASKGTTPFNVLFLGFSLFIIAAALMLVSLLFRLGIEQRADQVGLLLAVGLTRRAASRLMICEGLLVSIGGCVGGVAAGVGYAWLMLAGLRTWWRAAVVTPFLTLYVTPVSLIAGCVAGVVVSVLTIAWTTRQMRRVPLTRLIAGEAQEETAGQRGQRTWSDLLVVILLITAAMLGTSATHLGGEAQAGAFFGCGACVLAAMLTFIWSRLRASGASQRDAAGGFGLAGLAVRNAARNPGRSTLTIGLMAAATFLIVAISAFRLEPSSAGTGGFELMAESDQPIFADLNTQQGRRELLADRADVVDGCQVLALRVKPGDDASCRNLYQSRKPRILSVTPEMIAHFDISALPSFSWAASAAETDQQRANPWHLLAGSAAGESPVIPVVLDKNTAMYGLHLYGGIGEEFALQYDDATTVRFRVVGLLANSILQGSLLISEADLLRAFPDVSGYRYFLIRIPPAKQRELTSTLEHKLSDQGFDITETRVVLEGLLAVQNTYLSTFQSLGALGLLLGTFGLGTVQMRNVLERRGELALLRAAGFRRRRLAGLVMLENIFLLLGGLGAGIFSAWFAVLPHMESGAASIPFSTLGIVLAVVLLAGVISGLAAVRTTLRTPILSALRGN